MEFVKQIKLTGERAEDDDYDEEHWLVFEKNVEHLVDEDHQTVDNNSFTVQIAFLVSEHEHDGRPDIIRLPQSFLSVFFPTEKETHLGFLVQGPYITTPARDNVPSAHPFNITLAKVTGELVVEALRWLRDRDWLTVGVLKTMPLAYLERARNYPHSLTERNRYKYTLFAPIYECVKQALINEALIPAYGGGYVAAKDAKIAGSANIRKLLDTSQLQELLEFNDNTRWLSEEITEGGKTLGLWRYLTTVLDVEDIDAEKFVRRIDYDFIRNQSDDWIRRFYEFASTGSALLYILRDKPIIRLQGNSHVKPFHWNNEPQAYLPKAQESRYPTVKREVCNNAKSLEFLKKLGLKAPDVVDEVLTYILPKYRSGQEIGEDEHQKDIVLIVRALGVDSQTRKSELVNALKQTPFVISENSVGDSLFRKPGEVYFRNSTREMYFDGNPDGWFISSTYQSNFNDLTQLGILTDLVTIREPNHLGYVKIRTPYKGSEYDPHKRGKHGFDPGFKIDGLEFALSNPSCERSSYIWNRLLIPHKHSIIGEVESCPVQTFPSARTTVESNVLSRVGHLVREFAWLPDSKGKFFKPSELPLEYLLDDIRRDDELADALGMNVSRFDIDDAPDSIKAIVVATQGRSPTELKEALDLLDEKKKKERENVEVFEPDEHSSELLGGLNRTGSPKIPRTPINDYPDDTSEDKRIKTELEIGNEPDPEERYELRIKRLWKPKNPETRKFLNIEYPDGCQIHNCNHSFLKRDGLPYFEAVHIIPRTSAEWLDHPRNAVCLCAHHAAQWKHGVRSTADLNILEQIKSSEEGLGHDITVELCGESHDVMFTANHIDEVRIALEVTEYM